MTISTKDQPGPFDGMERAKPGEPVFTLQGGDPLAPALVLKWAEQQRELVAKAALHFTAPPARCRCGGAK